MFTRERLAVIFLRNLGFTKEEIDTAIKKDGERGTAVPAESDDNDNTDGITRFDKMERRGANTL